MITTQRALGAGLIAAVLMGTVNIASATTWNFGGPFGSLGADEVFTVGSDSVTASAFTYSESGANGIYSVATLIRRNELPNDVGLGVCNSNDGASCTTDSTGNGENNEIDNNGPKDDLIRLDFGSSRSGLVIQLSSVENDSDGNDDYAIYGSNVATPKLSTLVALATGNGSGGANPIRTLSGNFRYLFVTVGSAQEDDFLLRSATASSAVPEPASLLLMGSGLAGIAVWRRRSKG